MRINSINDIHHYPIKFSACNKKPGSAKEQKPFSSGQISAQILGSLLAAYGSYGLYQNVRLEDLYSQAQTQKFNLGKLMCDNGFEYKEIAGLKKSTYFDISINNIKIPGSLTVDYLPDKMLLTLKHNGKITYADLIFTKQQEPLLIVKSDKNDSHGTIYRLDEEGFYSSSDVSAKTASLLTIIAGLLAIGASGNIGFLKLKTKAIPELEKIDENNNKENND